MPLQARDFFGNLPADPLDPTGTDSRTISDNQHREILASLSGQAPNWTGQITATHGDLNTLQGIAASGTKVMPGVGGLTVLFFYNVNTPPPGWSLLVPDANIRQLVIGDAINGGTIGGTQNPTDMSDTVNITISISGNTGNTTLTADQSGMPAHDVNVAGWNLDGFSAKIRAAGSASGQSILVPQPVAAQGAAQGHNHTFSGSGGDSDNVRFTPRYASGILGVLDA